jgi:capsular polysaccharide biosynthesis protein
MKERFVKFLNKNLKMILIIAVIIVIAMGLLLMLISGNDEDRNQVPINPAETEQQDGKDDKKDRPLAEIGDHPGVSDTALNMYNSRVDDITDTAQVAQLVEATDMREEMGGYLVTLKVKDGVDTVVVAFEKKLKAGEELAFDEMATWYAEQLLALIETADAVQWT